jgi:hypothetical protein
VQELYERAIADYLFMRKASAEEMQIMALNRVNVEKDVKQIIENTARHVGLEMPVAYSDSADQNNKDKSN